MVRTSTLWVALASATTALADSASCDLGNRCPESTPCCSQYGACGVGAYCLGGCDPRSSFSLNSCAPEPVCQSKTYTFDSLDSIQENTVYLGNSSAADWVASGTPVIYDDSVLLTMAPNTVGTLLASTVYMWYGNVKATFKTSRGQGVVTAFILLSDVKDEIDYEFVGVDLEHAQSNYYFQGIPDYNNEQNISLSDTFANFHTYEIDWTPTTITWLVDGQVGRTLDRSSTWNATANQWNFPQTPARVQLSLWPAGLASNGQGTVDWAGGLVNWDSADIQANGYYYAQFQSVTISCYNASSPPGTNTGVSYYYDDYAGTNNTVVDGTNGTVLASFEATGLDPEAGKVTGSATTGTSASNTAESVPGESGVDPGVNAHSTVASSASSGSTATAAASGSASTESSSSTNGFDQGTGSTSSKSGADKLGVGQEKVLKGSMFAGIVAVVAMMAL